MNWCKWYSPLTFFRGTYWGIEVDLSGNFAQWLQFLLIKKFGKSIIVIRHVFCLCGIMKLNIANLYQIIDLVVWFLYQFVQETVCITLVFVVSIEDWLIDHKGKIKFSLGSIFSEKYCDSFLKRNRMNFSLHPSNGDLNLTQSPSGQFLKIS